MRETSSAARELAARLVVAASASRSAPLLPGGARRCAAAARTYPKRSMSCSSLNLSGQIPAPLEPRELRYAFMVGDILLSA